MSLDRDEDLEEEERKNHEIEDKRTVKERHPSPVPNFQQLQPLLFSPQYPPMNS